MSSNQVKKDKLAKKTVQIIGFGTSFFLIAVKLFLIPEADIPWWVIGGFFGVGVSAEFSFDTIGGKK